jgi:hypothetical protein
MACDIRRVMREKVFERLALAEGHAHVIVISEWIFYGV